jgi:hypothetical protein
VYCSKCGSKVNEQDQFCPTCGMKLEGRKQEERDLNIPTPTVPSTSSVVQKSEALNKQEYRISNDGISQNNRYYEQRRKSTNGTNLVIGIALFLILFIGGLFLARPHIKNFINQITNKNTKGDFLEEKKDNSSDSIICTGYGDSIDMQMTLSYQGSNFQKVKYSFIYDKRKEEDVNIGMTCTNGDCTSKNQTSVEEQNRLMLYMMLNMEENICTQTGVSCLEEDGTPYYKSAFEFTPSLMYDFDLKTSYTNDFIGVSKEQVKKKLTSMYGLTCN